MAITLYDLAGAEDDRRFSPYCWRIRMALKHKGLEFETLAWRFSGDGYAVVGVDLRKYLATFPESEPERDRSFGVGIAATYMPGLRLLSERVSGPSQSRYVAFYTSFFGIGTALSLAIAGFTAPALGWRSAFSLSAVGPVLAGALVYFSLGALPRRHLPNT